MNTNNKLLLAATLVTVMNFQSCSKYDDNPAFSLRTKKSRLVGEWEVVRIDDQTSSQYFGPGYTYTFEFESDGDFEMGYSYSYGSYSSSYSQAGEWEWEDGKETIEIEVNSYIMDCEIKKLTNNELKLVIDNQEIELEKN